MNGTTRVSDPSKWILIGIIGILLLGAILLAANAGLIPGSRPIPPPPTTVTMDDADKKQEQIRQKKALKEAYKQALDETAASETERILDLNNKIDKTQAEIEKLQDELKDLEIKGN